MKVALIGYGYWGKILKRYIEQNEKFNLKKVFIRNRSRHEEDQIYTTVIEDIWVDKEIEAVFIATPVSTHLQYISEAMQFGKHVFCEKPLSKIVEGNIECLLRKVNAQNKIIYTDYIYTVSPSINKMKKVLYEIGDIHYIRGDIKQFGNFYKHDDVYEVLSVHLISAILYILDIEDADAIRIKYVDLLKSQDSGLTLIGNIQMSYNNIKCEINSSLVSSCKIRQIEIVGQDGSLLFDMMNDNTLEMFKYNIDAQKPGVQKLKSWNYEENNNLERVLHEFYQRIIENNNEKNFKLACNVNTLLGRKYGEHN